MTINPFTKIWFWLLLLSIVGFIMFFIFIETQGETAANKGTTPMWIWILFMISLGFFLLAFILYAIDLSNYHKNLEILEACGELPPPKEKKKRDCPKQKCVEKRILECTDRTPCDKLVSKTTETVTVDKKGTSNPETITVDKKVTLVPETFSSTKVNSLNTLSPMSSPTN